jgi:hypothetical protein
VIKYNLSSDSLRCCSDETIYPSTPNQEFFVFRDEKIKRSVEIKEYLEERKILKERKAGKKCWECINFSSCGKKRREKCESINN